MTTTKCRGDGEMTFGEYAGAVSLATIAYGAFIAVIIYRIKRS
jgi:hypothetical protein